MYLHKGFYQYFWGSVRPEPPAYYILRKKWGKKKTFLTPLKSGLRVIFIIFLDFLPATACIRAPYYNNLNPTILL